MKKRNYFPNRVRKVKMEAVHFFRGRIACNIFGVNNKKQWRYENERLEFSNQLKKTTRRNKVTCENCIKTMLWRNS